jgi:hypothetical protein
MKILIVIAVLYGSVVASSLVFFSGSAPATSTITIGETTVLSIPDSNANTLIAQIATLPQTATIKSLSFYANSAVGNLILGIYDNDGLGGGPGTKLAETAGFTPITGWNTVNVISESLLAAGDYWLVFNPSGAMGTVRNNAGPESAYYSRAYDGTLPSTFAASPSLFAAHWSMYATLQP